MADILKHIAKSYGNASVDLHISVLFHHPQTSTTLRDKGNMSSVHKNSLILTVQCFLPGVHTGMSPFTVPPYTITMPCDVPLSYSAFLCYEKQ